MWNKLYKKNESMKHKLYTWIPKKIPVQEKSTDNLVVSEYKKLNSIYRFSNIKTCIRNACKIQIHKNSQREKYFPKFIQELRTVKGLTENDYFNRVNNQG